MLCCEQNGHSKDPRDCCRGAGCDDSLDANLKGAGRVCASNMDFDIVKRRCSCPTGVSSPQCQCSGDMEYSLQQDRCINTTACPLQFPTCPEGCLAENDALTCNCGTGVNKVYDPQLGGCQCAPGYEAVGGSGKCRDVNECTAGTHN